MSTPWGPTPPDGSGNQPQQGGYPQGVPPAAGQPGWTGLPPQQGYPSQPGYQPQQGFQPDPGHPQPAYPQGYQPGQPPQGWPPQGYGPVTVGSQPQKSRRGRVALVAGAVVVALGLTGGGVLALTNGWFSSGAAGGAASPEAAAVSFVESAVKLDGADVLASVAPSERAVVADLVDVAERLPEAQDETQAARSAFEDLRDALEITLPDAPTFSTEELVPGVSKATITGGSVKVDGDPDRLADAVIAFMKASGAPSDETDDEARAEIRDDIDEQLPVQKDLTDLMSMMNLDDDLFLVAVQENGKWYVSASMTVAQYVAESQGVTKDQLGKPIPAGEMKRFATPEDAVTGLYDAIEATADTGDLRELAKALPPAESRLLAVYGPVLSDGNQGGSDDGSPQALSDLSASTLETDGDHAYVALDSFTADVGSGVTLEFRRDGKKFTLDSKQGRDATFHLVLDGTDPKRWTLTADDPQNDANSMVGSLSIPRRGEIEGEYTSTSDGYGGKVTQSGSFSFDGDCLEHTYDDGYDGGYYDDDSSGRTCGLAESIDGTGLEKLDALPDLSRLLSVTTLKSGDSWYASPSATVVSLIAELSTF